MKKIRVFEAFADEEWRDIPGYEGQFQASTYGRIKRLPKTVSNHTGCIYLKERILNGSRTKQGYIHVELQHSPHRIIKKVHRLIAITFLPNPNNYPQVNHINGIKWDNRLENIEWCNNSMNQIHAYANGLNVHSGKSGRPKRKIKLEKVSNGEELIFDSISETVRFLGDKRHIEVNLMKTLSPKYKSHKTIYGYKASYAK